MRGRERENWVRGRERDKTINNFGKESRVALSRKSLFTGSAERMNG